MIINRIKRLFLGATLPILVGSFLTLIYEHTLGSGFGFGGSVYFEIFIYIFGGFMIMGIQSIISSIILEFFVITKTDKLSVILLSGAVLGYFSATLGHIEMFHFGLFGAFIGVIVAFILSKIPK